MAWRGPATPRDPLLGTYTWRVRIRKYWEAKRLSVPEGVPRMCVYLDVHSSGGRSWRARNGRFASPRPHTLTPVYAPRDMNRWRGFDCLQLFPHLERGELDGTE
jgi:hypothetical protein